MVIARTTVVMLLVSLVNVAWAQSQVPDRQIPPSVLSELRLLENRFDIALAADCDAQRCFSKGCTYVEHAVADQPRSMSLPGLAQEAGPGSVPTQEYLTQAHCSYAYEDSAEAGDIQALTRRLQSKVSKGWTVVSVNHERLQPVPDYLQEAPVEEPPPEPEPVEEPEVIEPPATAFAIAVRELWTSLLPHFWWMIGLVMLTFAGTLLIWAWRRVGRASIEEQMLMAELERGDGGFSAEDDGDAADADDAADDTTFVSQQHATWRTRLESMDAEHPDLELQALIRTLLRAGDLPLLAKAVLRFPDTFPTAFPAGGEVASAKLELADYLKTVDADALPSDADFFRSLNRHALSAAVSSQSDAEIVRSLREEFGAFGLASVIGKLPARAGSLLFALAPADEQLEMVRLLTPQQVADMSQMLLRSNRMDSAETAYLFDVVSAVRSDQPLPTPTQTTAISDLGAEFDAVGALSVLLESVNPDRRAALFADALQRFQGSLPAWYRGILLSDMLLKLAVEARADLLLEVDVKTLAAWLSLLDTETQGRLLAGTPTALQASVQASSVFPSRTEQLSLARRGRRDLAQAFQAQLARARVPFERVVQPQASADP